MNQLRGKALLVVLLMAMSSVLAHYWRPTQHMADTGEKINLENIFPKVIGGWGIDNNIPIQLISPDLQANLNKIYNQVLSRTYVNDKGERIMLSVAYGGDQSDGTRAHRPEVCYPAQGFEILSNQPALVQTSYHPIKARRLLSKLGARSEPITYWIIVGDKVVISGTEQKLAQLQFGVRGIVPDGMLVRVSSIDSDEQHGYALQQKFIASMSDAIAPAWRARVMGSSKS